MDVLERGREKMGRVCGFWGDVVFFFLVTLGLPLQRY